MRIAAFSPSSPADSEKIQKGIELIQTHLQGAQVVLFSDIPGSGPFPYLAQNDTHQAQLFHDLLTDSTIDMVWAMRGGYGSLRWLNMVDWQRLFESSRKNPLIGFSDVTFLHSALLNIHWPILIHGPLLTTLAKTDDTSLNALWHLIRTGNAPTLSGEPLQTGTVIGHLIGGNLTCLVHTLGTAFEPPWKGAILVMEDHNEALYRIDRMLTHLKLTGRLSQLAGIAVGRIEHTSFDEGQLNTLLLNRLKDLNIPMAWKLPIGHGAENAPLMLGEEYELNGETGQLIPIE
ncbi:MAG: LD-carboxypeptidase [Dissulfuribacterales bacterium]